MGALSLHVFMLGLWKGFRGVREEEVRSLFVHWNGPSMRMNWAQIKFKWMCI